MALATVVLPTPGPPDKIRFGICLSLTNSLNVPEFCIPYVSPIDGRVHRYFPDFLIKVKEKNGSTKTYVIEVKPKKQTKPPERKSKKVTKSFIYEAKTYEVNKAKWRAATEWCKDRRLEFKIITEDELGIK